MIYRTFHFNYSLNSTSFGSKVGVVSYFLLENEKVYEVQRLIPKKFLLSSEINSEKLQKVVDLAEKIERGIWDYQKIQSEFLKERYFEDNQMAKEATLLFKKLNGAKEEAFLQTKLLTFSRELEDVQNLAKKIQESYQKLEKNINRINRILCKLPEED